MAVRGRRAGRGRGGVRPARPPAPAPCSAGPGAAPSGAPTRQARRGPRAPGCSALGRPGPPASAGRGDRPAPAPGQGRRPMLRSQSRLVSLLKRPNSDSALPVEGSSPRRQRPDVLAGTARQARPLPTRPPAPNARRRPRPRPWCPSLGRRLGFSLPGFRRAPGDFSFRRGPPRMLIAGGCGTPPPGAFPGGQVVGRARVRAEEPAACPELPRKAVSAVHACLRPCWLCPPNRLFQRRLRPASPRSESAFQPGGSP